MRMLRPGLIQLIKISKNFGPKTVLKEIDLSFEEGKTHVLLGQSGSGKSTLIRIILGLIAPSSGVVRMNDQPISQARAQRMGYVVQEGGLFPHLTGRENAALPALGQEWSEEKVRARLNELEKLMQFEPGTLDRYPSQLSGGQRQRVGLMRALFLDPPVLLLDEPLAALDPIVRSGLQDDLKKLFNSLKKTVLIVTHDLGEAVYFGHTITLLNEGTVLQHGTFHELAQKPTTPFVTEFIQAQRPAPEIGKELS